MKKIKIQYSIWKLLKKNKNKTSNNHPHQKTDEQLVYTNQDKAEILENTFNPTFGVQTEARLLQQIEEQLYNIENVNQTIRQTTEKKYKRYFCKLPQRKHQDQIESPTNIYKTSLQPT